MNKRSIRVLNWRNRVKQKLVEYKGGKCERCGYNKPCWSAYDFHHIDPAQKEFSISGKTKAFDKIKSEVDKCLLLCRNCHAEVHWEETQEARLERLKIKKHTLSEKECKFCRKLFKPECSLSEYCSTECSNKSRSKVKNKPSKEELQSLINKNSYCAVGRMYKVSDNAVRKWAKKYGLI